ncbi:MGMT family protein [Candidatus Daviesbacteria bacterium]|nr:MGMT family protein [Candidatus Daviesbacteria bacterium]
MIFKEKVYLIVSMIPAGRVASYGQVAALVGMPRAAQAVGQVLHRMADEKPIPWQRVINRHGRISTKCTFHPATLQKALLEQEGISVGDDLMIDVAQYSWQPDLSCFRQFIADDTLQQFNSKLSLDRRFRRSSGILKSR